MQLHKTLVAFALTALTLGSATTSHAESAARPATAETPLSKAQSVVNIIDATAEQLERLPGIRCQKSAACDAGHSVAGELKSVSRNLFRTMVCPYGVHRQ